MNPKLLFHRCTIWVENFAECYKNKIYIYCRGKGKSCVFALDKRDFYNGIKINCSYTLSIVQIFICLGYHYKNKVTIKPNIQNIILKNTI